MNMIPYDKLPFIETCRRLMALRQLWNYLHFWIMGWRKTQKCWIILIMYRSYWKLTLADTADANSRRKLRFHPVIGHEGLRENRCIALLLSVDLGTRWGVGGQRHAPAAFTLRERPDSHCTGGWMGLGTSLDRCWKSSPHRDSIPVPSSP